MYADEGGGGVGAGTRTTPPIPPAELAPAPKGVRPATLYRGRKLGAKRLEMPVDEGAGGG